MGFLMPKAPAMPQMVMPEVKDVPNYEDEERKLTEAKELKEATRKEKVEDLLFLQALMV